eukprot:CAMPEP_0171994164 /NCGR_PEP_ID=MMETSP0993-20121228/278815_1 /TAXON_ID=483369 /ORGANISM="non described non described, Strain CCMP2098" /LENGTH=276 /DNA_ID=CAMNT_0012647233 /DNA_START=1096 /DNA_END=1928 /DNA_ORIENTATION=-
MASSVVIQCAVVRVALAAHATEQLLGAAGNFCSVGFKASAGFFFGGLVEFDGALARREEGEEEGPRLLRVSSSDSASSVSSSVSSLEGLKPPECRGHRAYDVVSASTGVSVLNEAVLPLLRTALVGDEEPEEPAGDQRPQLEKTRSFRTKLNAELMRFAGIESLPPGLIKASANVQAKLCAQFWSSTCKHGEHCTYSHSPDLKLESEARQRAARKRRRKTHEAKGVMAFSLEMSPHDQALCLAGIAKKKQKQKKRRAALKAHSAAKKALSLVASVK